MENTVNDLLLNSNYVINITRIDILSYSSFTNTPNKATLNGIDSGLKYFHDDTLFNLINDTKLLISDKISSNLGINASSREYINADNNVILAYQSSITFNGLEITSNYQKVDPDYYFMRLVNIQNRTVSFIDVDFSLSGKILESIDPVNFYMRNIDVDYSRSTEGFSLLNH